VRVRHSYYVGFGAGTESSIYIVEGSFGSDIVFLADFGSSFLRVLTNQSGTALGVSFRESELRDSDAKCITRFLFPKGPSAQSLIRTFLLPHMTSVEPQVVHEVIHVGRSGSRIAIAHETLLFINLV